MPPVKDTTTGQEVRSVNKDYHGQPVEIFVSNEVTGELHWKNLPKEMHMTVEEFDDIRRKLVGERMREGLIEDLRSGFDSVPPEDLKREFSRLCALCEEAADVLEKYMKGSNDEI